MTAQEVLLLKNTIDFFTALFTFISACFYFYGYVKNDKQEAVRNWFGLKWERLEKSTFINLPEITICWLLKIEKNLLNVPLWLYGKLEYMPERGNFLKVVYIIIFIISFPLFVYLYGYKIGILFSLMFLFFIITIHMTKMNHVAHIVQKKGFFSPCFICLFLYYSFL